MYHHAIVGGTFDHLHLGHKHLLTTACNAAAHVTIGLSTPPLYRHKLFSQTIQPYEIRKKNLMDFLKNEGWLDKVKIIPLADIYGSSVEDTTLDAIIVSEETKNNAKKINALRQKKKLSQLTIISIPLLNGQDKKPISSEKVRLGEIDIIGNSYSLFLQQKSAYTLPSELRSQLQQPIGKIFSTEKELQEFKMTQPFITSVGDITTLSLFKAGLPPAIAFIDGKTQRHNIEESLLKTYVPLPTKTLTNQAGSVTATAASTYLRALASYLEQKTTQVILVEGEEDLLALPAILLSPLESYVLYGQHEVGMISVKITAEKKEYAKNLLSQFHAQQ